MVLYARDIVEKEFISLPPETSALDAARRMSRDGHGYVIVVSPANEPIGIVTEWDYISKVDAAGRDPAKTRLEEIMTRDLVSIDGRKGFEEVAQLMATRGIRRLLVIENGRLVGVVTARKVIERLNEYVTKIATQIARLQALPF
ncbi:MAG TPA: CBS domain-containing protein [Candidatus Binatus sp.]|nr:CBS domain-containing protein [Candidatus Binatus sp.]